MSKKTRGRTYRKWTADEKITILRDHFGKTRLLDTCEEHRVHPNVLNGWWKTVLEAGSTALSGDGRKEARRKDKLLGDFESEIARKDRIIAELAAEVLELKKPSGGI